MTTLTIEKSNFTRTHFIDEKDLFSYVINYMEVLEDINNVKKEIENNPESFDYNLIRQNYV